MLWFRDLSFGTKIVLYSTLASAVALCLLAGSTNVYHAVDHRREVVRSLTIQADVLAVNSTATLTFDDPSAAEESLRGLKAEPHIVHACIHDKNGEPFAHYWRNGKREPRPYVLEEPGHRFEGNSLIMFRPIELDGERIGTIHIKYELSALYAHLKRQAAIVGFAMLLSLGAAFLLSARLQGTLVRPVTELAMTAKTVSQEKDYSVRAVRYGQDELGRLTDAFNEMLGKIQDRDTALQRAREGLEVRVRERTADLTKANENLLGEITERKQAEQKLEELHKQLLDTSRQAGMAEIASGVLHNVGNVLTSASVSVWLAAEKTRKSRVSGLAKATELMSQHADDLGTFITADEKGKQLSAYLIKLAEHLTAEQAAVLEELASLQSNIDHIKSIISMQQSYTGVSGVVEPVTISNLLEDVLKMNVVSFEHHRIQVVQDYGEMPPPVLDKHKLLQILVNLVKNAKDALVESNATDRRLTLCTRASEEDRLQIKVIDNGVGISEANLTRIFASGFTTKKDGHGFGLHSSALMAIEAGGSLTCSSDGLGKGATFTLELPLRVAEVSR